MNKRINTIVLVLALLVTAVISFFPIPVYLVWTLRILVVVVALFGVYLAMRNKNEYRYDVAKDREKKAKEE